MADNTERTFIMVKPDGVERGLIPEIMKRFQRKGYKLVASKFMKSDLAHIQEHYVDLKEKKFYPGLCKYMSEGPVFPMVWEGQDVVRQGRILLGETDPLKSKPGTIRGDFCICIGRNICHGSDSVDSAKKEISHWFKKTELVDWGPTENTWIYE
ncbi:nucleoside diphosphate kinase B-like isoform X2 [Anneissia japonica]|uniref:nucleoside diphosphate kinase B-like isoform X1 n=1 Tax=Anneissia japonica TaxID=1529436 RepID=UPI0014256E43|nr:nucleoside diphosphate kinase B-like isoform X1 [Anneissia japonica]XP_033110206.1 nucleoside diphosphate kinase B-like isoform X2 [Anneissia japonica]